LFFPVVKRFAVDFVDGRFRDRHVARLSGHGEIDVVNCAVRSFHIDARKIFAAAKTGKPVLVDPHQIERQVFAPIVDVKLSVGGTFAFSGNVSFDPGRNIGIADLIGFDFDLRRTRRCCRRLLRRSCWYLGQLVDLRRLLKRVLRIEARRTGREE